MKESGPLHNLDAEMSTLGAMILKEAAAEDVLGILEEFDFYFPAHREIYRAMQALAGKFRPIDLVSLVDTLTTRQKLEESGGQDYIVQIAESVPSAANAKYYAGIVKDKSLLRNLNTAGHEIVKIASDPDLDTETKLNDAEAQIFGIGQRRRTSEPKAMPSLAKGLVNELDEIMDGKRHSMGITTGFYDLDDLTLGLRAGNLVIVAARPAMGKSALALKIAQHVANRVGTVIIFTLEMSAEEMTKRLATILAQQPSSFRVMGDLTETVYRGLSDAAERLYDLPLYIDDTSEISLMGMRGKCRRIAKSHGLALIVVDYIQLMEPGSKKKSSNRTEDVSEISRGLKAIAREFSVPVIALSQLSRAVEARANKRPMMSDLRESGQIEQDADQIYFLYRANYYKEQEGAEDADRDPGRTEEAELIVAKHRSGPTGMVKLAFKPKYSRFDNIARGAA